MFAAAMSLTLQGVFFLLALVCFVIAAIPLAVGKINFVAAGLALFVFVYAWQAFATA